MRCNLATICLSLLLAGICAAEDPVVRVQSIKPADDKGQASLRQKRPTDPPAGFRVSVNSLGYVKDHYITDANTIAALEFLIGGRVGINKNTDIEIVTERSVADGKTEVKRVILKNGGLWVKADAKSLKQPIEIQTNGGVMGIKGTEFTVEQQVDGSTKVCCFESNSSQGGVEVRDNSGKLVGTVKPGDEYLISLKAAPVVKHYEDVSKFREDTLQSGFNEMYNSPVFQTLWGAVGSYVPWGVGYGISAIANLQSIDVERDPVGAYERVRAALSVAGVSTPSLGWGGVAINAAAANRQPPKPDFPTELSPDASPNSTKTRQSGPFPQFSWAGVEDASGYVVMLGKDDNLNEILFSERVSGTSVNYPPDMRPLDAGQYYWRVVPVDSEDKPIDGKKASQTLFQVVK